MKVALVNLTSGGMSGGYRKYLKSLVPLLRRDSRVERIDVFMPAGLEPPDEGTVHSWPASNGIASLRRQLEQLRPDVVFFPTARIVRCEALPAVVMVRNMEPLTVPFGGNTWRESARNVMRAHVARQACRRASRVIAVSRHVEHFIVRTWRVPSERVGVVYHGIDPAGGHPTSAPAALANLDQFVFTAGSIRPARGLEDLIGAAPMLVRAQPGLKIVIAGRADESGKPYERRMRQLAARLGVTDAIVWAGHLASAEMAWTYDRCAAFVVTSRAEACPNIALEAMSHGVPIVSTTQAPMPEFFADVAAYYSPREPGELAARLTEILNAPTHVLAGARARMDRAATFTWQRTADRTIEELQCAVEMTG
jgi:glycosyltransferase involved in cell wall biosynthesis